MLDIFDLACELLPPWTKELHLCTVAPLPSLSPPPLPPFQVQYIPDWVAVGGGGGGVLSCVVDHILQELNTLFLTRFRTFKIATPPQTKMTVKTTFRGWCLYSSFVHALMALRLLQLQYQASYPVWCVLSEGFFLFRDFYLRSKLLFFFISYGYPSCCAEPEPAADRGAEPVGHQQEDLRLHPSQLPRLTHRQEHQAGGGPLHHK